MNILKISFFSTLLFSFGVSTAIASGGGGYGGGGGSYNQPTRPPVDQTYEVGKSIYKGRRAGAPKIKYCLNVDDEVVPLGRSSARKYKNTSVQAFSESLLDCNSPETNISQSLTRDDFLYVLYYLNKRYRLGLS